MILVEIGADRSGFPGVAHFASWAALCPGYHASAGQRKTGNTRKGNHAIRYRLCEAAHAARRTNSAFRSVYLRWVGRKGHKKAIIAVAHKMLRVMYFMFTRRQGYRAAGIDDQALVVDRNAPRWIQALKKYGDWPKSGPAETPVPAPVPA